MGVKPIVPVPADAPRIEVGQPSPPIWSNKRAQVVTLRPTAVYRYHMFGAVLRLEIKGNKITPPVMWCELPQGTHGWAYHAFPAPRPLYGVELLTAYPQRSVMVVEGEKCVDALRPVLPNYNVVTWAGGARAVKKSDWSVLAGKTVVIWPDADKPGQDAAEVVALMAQEAGASAIKPIPWDTTKPEGWDAADAIAEGWTGDAIIEWARKLREAVKEDTKPISKPAKKVPPFRPLGYSRGQFYFLPVGSQQIVTLTPQSLNKQNMTALAPLSYWEVQHPNVGRPGADWDSARDTLIRACERRGIFNEIETVRGRGARIDNGRSLFHLGGKTLVDDHMMLPHEVEGKHVYEVDEDLDVDIGDAANNDEASALLAICNRFNWSNSLSGALLAGWCIIAPVCGILRWRPHIWLTGGAGTGKSSIINLLIRPMLAQTGVFFESCTTEAAIRQTMKSDARPIVYDEADTTGKHGDAMLQAVLLLSRASSSGSLIRKGTTDGAGRSYLMRSAFCYASINPSVRAYADESRISKLVMQPNLHPDAQETWNGLKADLFKTITPLYGQRMFARSLKNLKTLNANAETFTDAARSVFPSQRTADQLGTLLSGAYFCCSDDLVDRETAIQWLKAHDWSEQTEQIGKRDEIKLLERILTHRLRVPSGLHYFEMTLGELIIGCHDNYFEDMLLLVISDARRELRRCGIIADNGFFYIANTSEAIKKILADTSWAHDWGRPLRDIFSAEITKNMYFISGINSRATKLSMKILRGGDDDNP